MVVKMCIRDRFIAVGQFPDQISLRFFVIGGLKSGQLPIDFIVVQTFFFYVFNGGHTGYYLIFTAEPSQQVCADFFILQCVQQDLFIIIHTSVTVGFDQFLKLFF